MDVEMQAMVDGRKKQ